MLQPIGLLDANTRYTFTVTSGLHDTAGTPFLPFTSHFITGTQGGAAGAARSSSRRSPCPPRRESHFTSVTIGPDGMLYAGHDHG